MGQNAGGDALRVEREHYLGHGGRLRPVRPWPHIAVQYLGVAGGASFKPTGADAIGTVARTNIGFNRRSGKDSQLE